MKKNVTIVKGRWKVEGISLTSPAPLMNKTMMAFVNALQSIVDPRFLLLLALIVPGSLMAGHGSDIPNSESCGMTASETHTNVACNGGSNGAIDLGLAGGTSPFTYAWSNGATTQDISGLGAGTFGVTVTDAASCTTTLSVIIMQPTALLVAPSHNGDVCTGQSTAMVSSNASGGTPTYTYLWTPGNLTTANLSNVGPGTYNLTVTDANGCTVTGSTSVGTFPAVPANFNVAH